MTTIEYQVTGIHGEITWAANECFRELSGKTYQLGKMEASDIIKIPELSNTAKILLSAVAGAIIQHLLDQGVSAQEIFEHGTFLIP